MRLLFFFLLIFLIIPAASHADSSDRGGVNCPQISVLTKLLNYTSQLGDTLASIANNYNLVPQTLEQFNPQLKDQILPQGTVVIVPPLNGKPIKAPPGSTWQNLSSAYGIRADVLFELNGCPKTPSTVFIPGVFTDQANTNKKNNYNGLSGYPLPRLAKVGLSYGWQKKVSPGKQVTTFFHSGVDLLAPLNTKVLAAESGIVVLAGREGSYGNLIIINHNGGLQTRYTQLNEIKVRIGTQVMVGQVIGTVGRTGEPDIPAPHLHFEVRYKQPVGWVSQDPLLHLIKTSP